MATAFCQRGDECLIQKFQACMETGQLEIWGKDLYDETDRRGLDNCIAALKKMPCRSEDEPPECKALRRPKN